MSSTIRFSTFRTQLGLTGAVRLSTMNALSGGTTSASTKASALKTQINTFTTTTLWHPLTALPMTSPTYSSGGITFTFENTNQFGQFNGSYMYDQSVGTSLTMDQYNALTGAFSGTRTVGGVKGHYQAIISATPFICCGYKGILGSASAGPGTIRVIATNDAVVFTTLDTKTVSSASEFVDGYATGSNGISNVFANSTAYKKYYAIFTTSRNVQSFTWQEWRWYMRT